MKLAECVTDGTAAGSGMAKAGGDMVDGKITTVMGTVVWMVVWTEV